MSAPGITQDKSSRAQKLKGPALLALIFLCLFWKLTFTKQYSWLESVDFANQVLPWYQFQATAWHSGHFPLWDPHEWGGQTVIGQVITGAAYPLDWILFLLPLKHGEINQTFVNWYFVLIHYMGALFCFLLLRDLNRSFTASLLGSLAFGIAGFFGAIDWPQMLNGAVWLPLVLLFFIRMMRGEKPLVNAALSGMFLGVSLLSGHHQVPVFAGLAMGGLWIYHLVMARHSGRARTAGICLGLFALFAVLTSGFQLLPAIEYGRLALRWVGASHPLTWSERVPYDVHVTFSFDPQWLASLILPGIADSAYMGLVILALAFIAVTVAWRQPMVRVFSVLALGGLLFALGGHSPLQGIAYALIPGVEKARTPAMAILIYSLALCVLAAYGLDHLLADADRERNTWIRRLTVFLFATGMLILAYVLIFAPMKLERHVEFSRYGFEALIALLAAALVYAWSRGKISLRAGAVLIVLLAIVELGSQVGYRMPPRDLGWPLLDNLHRHEDIAAFLREQPGLVRLEFDRTEIPYNFGDWYGIDGFETYLASLTTNIEKIRENPHVRQMFGINFYIGTKPRPNAGQVDVFTGRSGVKVWANPGTFPRAWSVHEAVSVRDQDEIFKLLEQSNEQLSRQTFVYGRPPALEKCAGPDEVSLATREINRVIIDANMQCKGMVIAGEGFFPGWKASIDGVPAPVYEAYTFLRGVVVNSGRHHIEMQYRPASVFWGAGMTIAGIAAACLLALFGKS